MVAIVASYQHAALFVATPKQVSIFFNRRTVARLDGGISTGRGVD